MNNSEKKAAVRAGTPTAASRKTFSINSILARGRDVKVLIKEPGEIPREIPAEKIPQSFISRKLRYVSFKGGDILIYEPKSKKAMNIAYGKTIIRGTALITSASLYRLREISDIDGRFVWLMNHTV